MVFGFTVGVGVVVTAEAAIVDAGVIHARRCLEGRGQVAGVTGVTGGNVIAGFAIGDNAVMTAIAVSWRAAEDPVDMAGLTGDLIVLSGKREAGC